MMGGQGGGVLLRPSVAETIHLYLIPFSFKHPHQANFQRQTNGRIHLVFGFFFP